MRVSITMGDPSGIGPEIILKALSIIPDHSQTYILYGHRPSFTIAGLEEISLERQFFEFVGQADEIKGPGKYFIETTPADEPAGTPGIESSLSGKASILALEAATRDLLNGLSDSLVTGPISKKAVHDAGFKYPGHTEFLAHRSGVEKVLMILVHQKLRVALQTIHIPLSEVPSRVTREDITSTLLFLNETLVRDFDVQNPVIDVLSLNPHAGDQGVIGMEEKTVILPAIDQVRQSGHNIGGPFPADGYFARATWKKSDAVLAMYHDQGLIPFKMLDEEAGVNVTAGLPFVRTSPDHGTAFGIASKGIASAKSMIMAIQMAETLIENRSTYAQPMDQVKE